MLGKPAKGPMLYSTFALESKNSSKKGSHVQTTIPQKLNRRHQAWAGLARGTFGFGNRDTIESLS